MKTNGKIILGFLLGTAIGTVAGLLLAPTTGFRTRKNLNKKAKKFVKQIEGFVGKGKVTASQTTTPVKNGKAPVSTR